MNGIKLTCFRISNGALAARELPTRLKILAWGDNPTPFGITPRVGAHSVRMFPRLMQAQNLDMVAIDYEHNTVKGTPAYRESKEPRDVAGYGRPLLIAGQGLFLEDIEWTPSGRESARNYIDLSPAVHLDEAKGEVDLMHSVALTRAGAVEGLSFYSMDANATGDTGMDWKAFLCNFTGQEADATDDDLAKGFVARITALCAEAVGSHEAVTTLNGEIDALSTKMAGLGVGEKGSEAAEQIVALSGTVQALEGKVSTLQADLAQRDRDAQCARAAREGKVIPLSAEQIAGMAVKDLGEMIDKLPVTVPLAQRTPEHVQALSAAAVSPALETVARKCGMDPAKVKELNAA